SLRVFLDKTERIVWRGIVRDNDFNVRLEPALDLADKCIKSVTQRRRTIVGGNDNRQKHCTTSSRGHSRRPLGRLPTTRRNPGQNQTLIFSGLWLFGCGEAGERPLLRAPAFSCVLTWKPHQAV